MGVPSVYRSVSKDWKCCRRTSPSDQIARTMRASSGSAVGLPKDLAGRGLVLDRLVAFAVRDLAEWAT